ncbi:MAG: family 20 glycosylhydrolase [Ignavibacteriales bacterium]|nr:MAG: family 20 glycosylhydrolase [Ignavibacteriales bacterium]
MYILRTFFLLFLLTGIMASQTPQLNLMPYPKEIALTGDHFRLTKDFDISIFGSEDADLQMYATRVLRRLSGRTGLFFPQDYVTSASRYDSSDLKIYVERPGKLQINEDESYYLSISSSSVMLKAQTTFGVMRGLETLLQMLASDAAGYYLTGARINDEPRFTWRGLMLDVCRHWMPMDVVKRNIDAMAAVKLNVLHLHLSEDQGFRIESKKYPQLHLLGSDGDYFTQEEIKDIIRYAGARGIRVYPEFDVPGHTTAWFLAFPELASAPGPYKIERNWGVFDPTMNPTIERTYEVLDTLFTEMAALFPDEYFHIGGDENNGKQWNANEDIQKFMKEKGIKDNHELQAMFNKRILQILTRNGKKMIGWDEIFQPELPKDIVIHSWRGVKYLFESARKGYMGILSNGYYIDLIQSAEFHYLNDPAPVDSVLTAEERARILGGEATMWAELVTPETVDSRIWPRTIAIAERFWSPGTLRDVESMYSRMEQISYQLEETGVLHIKNYEMMLRRLTGYRDITPLKKLADIVEPVKIYTRHRQGVKYTSYSPYTRVVDAARPESMISRRVRLLFKELMEGNTKNAAELKSILKGMKDNHAAMKELFLQSPVLREMEPISENIAKLSQLGIEAVDIYLSKKKPAKNWHKNVEPVLLEAEKPYGQTEIPFAKTVSEFVHMLIK